VEGLARNGHLITLRRGDLLGEVQVAVVRSVARAGRADQGELRRFRGEVYDCFTARADALFDLVDGLCTPVTVGEAAYLSRAAAIASPSRVCAFSLTRSLSSSAWKVAGRQSGAGFGRWRRQSPVHPGVLTRRS
jgi:hypothetical protein